jgi:hypothetical protein
VAAAAGGDEDGVADEGEHLEGPRQALMTEFLGAYGQKQEQQQAAAGAKKRKVGAGS